ncbi:uncharacterized protein [Halyomorpha halys]|uniref:uncharacterized protein isoform X2 n=1 Tax=Halyomorpha halys TaxID=286706 RepID=UPI0006D5021E
MNNITNLTRNTLIPQFSSVLSHPDTNSHKYEDGIPLRPLTVSNGDTERTYRPYQTGDKNSINYLQLPVAYVTSTMKEGVTSPLFI